MENYEKYNDLLFNLNQSYEQLIDVIGYFMTFEDKSSELLEGIALVFEKATVYIFVQEGDDTLILFTNKKDYPLIQRLQAVSLIKQTPWVKAKGKPLLWSWMLYNQKRYFDGLQLEFAENSSDVSTVIQLYAIGSQIMLRKVSNTWGVITIKGNDV